MFACNKPKLTRFAQQSTRDFRFLLLQRIEPLRVYYPLSLIMLPPQHYVYNWDTRCLSCRAVGYGQLPIGSVNREWLE